MTILLAQTRNIDISQEMCSCILIMILKVAIYTTSESKGLQLELVCPHFIKYNNDSLWY